MSGLSFRHSALGSLRSDRAHSGQQGHWLSWTAAALMWLAFGLTTGFWALRWIGMSPPQALPVASGVATEIDSQTVARVLGARPESIPVQAVVPLDVSGRYVLRGVLARRNSHDGPAGQGVALISIDGQRAVTASVGATFDGKWIVKAVSARSVTLVPSGEQANVGAGSFTLQLPVSPTTGASASSSP